MLVYQRVTGTTHFEAFHPLVNHSLRHNCDLCHSQKMDSRPIDDLPPIIFRDTYTHLSNYSLMRWISNHIPTVPRFDHSTFEGNIYSVHAQSHPGRWTTKNNSEAEQFLLVVWSQLQCFCLATFVYLLNTSGSNLFYRAHSFHISWCIDRNKKTLSRCWIFPSSTRPVVSQTYINEAR